MSADPWESIGQAKDSFTLRRVDPGHPADFFWGKDSEGRCALILVVDADVKVDEPRPVLNGIKIIEASDHDGQNAFVLVLRRDDDRELFRHLCDDIVRASRDKVGHQAFLATTIRRAWKWHSLLRGGGLQRLGPEEQQGLIGELLFLEALAARLSPKAAIEAWRGPLDEPKDFVFGDRAAEVKARHAGKDAVKISSESQLQTIDGQQLHMVVFGLTPSAPDAPDAMCLDSLVDRVRAHLVRLDPASEEGFESRLLGAGYGTDQDYTDCWWALTAQSAYSVEGDFPRIEAAGLPSGVGSVTYWLQLDRCAPFERRFEQAFPGEAG